MRMELCIFAILATTSILYASAVDIWSYQVVPQSQTGATLIGGSGGSEFSWNEYGAHIKTLRVWVGGAHGGLKYIYAEMSNGNIHTAGVQPNWTEDDSITFDDGETIVGDITIGGNGIGTRTGYLGFKTSKGKEFKAGTLHTGYYFPADGALLGLWGWAGSDINYLGLIMMKKISGLTLTDVVYPTITSYRTQSVPTVTTDTACNSFDGVQTHTTTFKKETGESHSWSVTAGFVFGMTYQVEAGYPFLFGAKTDVNWQISASGTYSSSTDSRSSLESSISWAVPPRSTETVTISQWITKVDLPYNAKAAYTFEDGSYASFPVSGIYQGVLVSDVNVENNGRNLTAGEVCPMKK
jgi:hypothetical protein